jgi:hypothetical protein
MPESSCRCVLLAVMSGTVLRLRSGITASNTHLQEDTGMT